jgi:hypothetical protein
MGDGVDAEAAAPTEMAGTAEADTQSVYAWGEADLDAGQDDVEPRRLTPRRITAAAVAASLAAVVGASVVGFYFYYLRDESSSSTAPPATLVPAAPPPTLAPPPGPPPPVVLQGVDGKFIADMRRFGVPVSDQDPQWTVNLAHALCATVHDSPQRYPVGTNTIGLLVKGVMENNPDWNRQQATRFTDGAVDQYCPDVRGPSPGDIAAMPPDARYLATLQDRLGMTPVDDSLVRAGHQVCDWKAQGWWNDKIVDAINSPNSRADEQVMVEVAVDVYCPQFS